MERESLPKSDEPGYICFGNPDRWKIIPGLFQDLSYALVLVHPGCRSEDPEFYEMFHGYEICNSGIYWPENRIQKMKSLMPSSRPVKGIDCHSLGCFNREDSGERVYPCNEVEEEIRTEQDIIRWIKSYR